jgi:hypothetical protein
MIKKLSGLFLWFCAATCFAQLCILGIAAGRGNLNSKTMARVLAALNGVDIQGEKLKNVLVSAREAPTPTYDDVLKSKVKASLELDSRQESLDRFQRQIADKERLLKEEIVRFEARRNDFNLELDRLKKGASKDSMSETNKIMENLSPEQAKSQLFLMMKNNEKGEVVSIIRTMPADKQKKLLAEFNTDEDQARLNEILKELRNNAPLDRSIENARADKNGSP